MVPIFCKLIIITYLSFADMIKTSLMEDSWKNMKKNTAN